MPLTRIDLYNEMKTSGALERAGRNNPQWKQAFELYKKETKDHHVSMDCGTCYEKVKRWLSAQ